MIDLTIKIKNGSSQAVVLDQTCLTDTEQGHAERAMQSRYCQIKCQIVQDEVWNQEGCLAEGMETVLQNS